MYIKVTEIHYEYTETLVEKTSWSLKHVVQHHVTISKGSLVENVFINKKVQMKIMFSITLVVSKNNQK